MNLYTSNILKEKNRYFLNIGAADFLNNETISKINSVTSFIQENIYQEQIDWHFNNNKPLLEIEIEENEKIIPKSPYLKFIYNTPSIHENLKDVISLISREIEEQLKTI